MNAFRRILIRLVTVLWGLVLAPQVFAQAATNVARGGLGGVDNGTLADGGGTGQARITLDVVDLALRKEARDTTGTVLPDDAPVTRDQEITFLLIVDNPTDAAADDLRLTDPLDDTQFDYVAGSLEWTVVPSGATDAQIWSGNWTSLTDAPGAPDDAACAVDTGGLPGVDRITVGAVPTQLNLPASAPAHSLWAVRFRVRVR
jgi:hypothetical protein